MKINAKEKLSQNYDASKEPDVTPETKGDEQNPRKIKNNFFKITPNFFERIFKKKSGEGEEEVIAEPDSIQPLLFLIKENGYTDVLENVKSGEFIISTPKGEKSIWLTPDKLTTIKIAGEYYKGWIAYENCMTPYPEDPIYSSELNRKIIQRIAINYRDLNESQIIQAKTKRLMWIIGIIVIGLVLIFSTDLGSGLIALMEGGGKQATQSAVEVVKQNITNTGGVVVQ